MSTACLAEVLVGILFNVIHIPHVRKQPSQYWYACTQLHTRARGAMQQGQAVLCVHTHLVQWQLH